MIKEREKWNISMFIISYVLNNLVSGILYDTYINYLQEVSISTATSFWAYYGYATFISAIILFLVPKIGYKKLLVICNLSCAAAFLSVILLNSQSLFQITALLALVGIQLHYIILAPYIASYTDNIGEDNIKWYTRAYYSGYVGYFLATYLGGLLTVKMFSLRAGETFHAAKKITEHIADLVPEVKVAYLQGTEDVLLMAGILAAAAVIPSLLVKEHKDDYRDPEVKVKTGEIVKILLKRDAFVYLVYWAFISFAMGLFSSYITVFLNRNLHIDKATSSLLVSISYIAIVLFMFITPHAVRKFGRVGTICFTFLTSIPFMLIIANGDQFNSAMIPVVGFALFMRAGLANLGSPAESAVSMDIAPKNLRPAFTSIINFVAGSVSILCGHFTGTILFTTEKGYGTAYYIAAALYLAACGIMFFGLRKYNRPFNGENNEKL